MLSQGIGPASQGLNVRSRQISLIGFGPPTLSQLFHRYSGVFGVPLPGPAFPTAPQPEVEGSQFRVRLRLFLECFDQVLHERKGGRVAARKPDFSLRQLHPLE